jgi:hypothetical protein
VESAIAASVLAAALNNIFPLVQRRRWLVAFVFGLIHGFGFASVLLDLGLPKDSLLISLFSFNAGVEIGQLAIVGAFLPLVFLIRESVIYKRGVIVAGSAVIALIALNWMMERVFDN